MRNPWCEMFQAYAPASLKPGIHGARTHWIRGFMTFRLVRRTRAVR